MDFKVHQHHLTQLSGRFNLMVTLVVGLLMTNVLMAVLAFYAHVHQKILVTPFFGDHAYTQSEGVVDEKYLALMGENFIYLRLNVTPETARVNHKRLLSFVDAHQYSAFRAQLEKEALLISKQQISSHFEISSIKPQSSSLSCDICGVLKRRVGNRALRDEVLTYRIQFQYHLGLLQITQFTSLKGDAHA